MMKTSLTRDEFFAISRELEQYHAVFYKLWELGRPVFTKSIPTAAVQFDKKGNCVNFLFNPDFWEEMDNTNRLFVICHECLHVILNHGIRIKDAKSKTKANRGLDIVVNHILVEKYGFKRQDVDPESEYCWVDTIFPGQKMPTNQTFEYYFNRIKSIEIPASSILVDIHDFLDGSESDGVIDKLDSSLTSGEKAAIKDMIQKHFEGDQDKDEHGQWAGTEVGSAWKFIEEAPVQKKPKWETVIKKWSKKFIRTDTDTFEHWVRLNRRIVELPDDVLLPTEIDTEGKPEKGKIDVYFFMDASLSCADFATRFFRAAESLPTRRFKAHIFSFDTIVYDINIKERKMKGFGGTAFNILEAKIQKNLKKKIIKKYPDGVFVLTDGYGTKIEPEKPGRWYWFLTEHASSEFIPKNSNTYHLRNFE